jgi:hypothetical protein
MPTNKRFVYEIPDFGCQRRPVVPTFNNYLVPCPSSLLEHAREAAKRDFDPKNCPRVTEKERRTFQLVKEFLAKHGM